MCECKHPTKLYFFSTQIYVKYANITAEKYWKSNWKIFNMWRINFSLEIFLKFNCNKQIYTTSSEKPF
jgi:hypothetical protein